MPNNNIPASLIERPVGGCRFWKGLYPSTREQETQAYCRLWHLPYSPDVEPRKVSHQWSDLPLKSVLRPRKGRYTDRSKWTAPTTFFKLTKAERATLINRPLTYTSPMQEDR